MGGTPGRRRPDADMARAYEIIEIRRSPQRVAAGQVGVSKTTIQNWVKRWRGDSALAARLRARVDQGGAGAGADDGEPGAEGDVGDPTVARLEALWTRLDGELVLDAAQLDEEDRRGPGRCRMLDADARWAWMVARGLGLSEDRAALAAGVPVVTARRWRLAGEQGREPYATWLAWLEQADARGELVLALRVAGGEPGYQGALSLLERRRAADYQRRQHVEVESSSPFEDLAPEEVEAMLREAEAQVEIHDEIVELGAADAPIEEP